MQIAGELPLARGAAHWPRSRTERQWLTALGILAASVAVAALLHALERGVGRWNPELRLVHAPTETVMRLFGMSHVLVATLYLVTSRSMRSLRGQTWFAATLALGVALCLGFHRLAGLSPAIASALFLLYFAAHDFRDQVHFYFEHGEAPEGPARADLTAALYWMPMSILWIAAAGTAALTATGAPGTGRMRHLGASLPAAWRWGLAAVVAAALVLSVARAVRAWRRLGAATLPRFLRTHRPIVVVFAGTFALVLLGVLPGWNAQLLVGLHVVAWYVFTLRRLRRRPAGTAPRPGTWSWLRGTPAGFNLLHLGSLALLIAGAAVWAYGFRGDPGVVPLRLALDPELFPGWTLLHVTLSFRPR